MDLGNQAEISILKLKVKALAFFFLKGVILTAVTVTNDQLHLLCWLQDPNAAIHV